MPTYDYRCKKCEHTFELFHSMSDESVKKCPKCKSRAMRVPAGGAGLLFRGSGFYITDYRSRSYKDGATKEKGGGKAKEGKSGGSDGGSGGGKAKEGKSGGSDGGSGGKSSGTPGKSSGGGAAS